jgi:hypothetical protein
MKDEYPLHIINEIISMVDLLRDLLDTYKCREIITSGMNYSYNCSRRRSIVVHHTCNTFNLGDHIRFDI